MTLDTIYLQNFIDALDSGDPRRLGIRNKKKARAVWKKVFTDYTHKMGGAKSTALLMSARAVTSLRLRIEILRRCVGSLSKGYHRETAEMLSSLGVRTKVNRLTLERDLMRVISEIKSQTMQLRLMQKEADSHIKSAEGVDVRAEYSRTLIELSKYLGYHFDPKKQTVSEFIYAVKKLEQDAKQ